MSKGIFSPQFFKANRGALKERLDAQVIVVPAHCSLQRTGDSTYAFRQDSNFYYLTGVDEPDCVLVILPKESYIISPTQSRIRTIFDGAISSKDVLKQSGVDAVYGYREGWQKLKKQLKAGTKVGFPLPASRLARLHSLSLNPARRIVLAKLRRLQPTLEIVDIRPQLADLRSVKQPEEIEALKTAIAITSKTLKDVFEHRWYKSYKYEYEVEAELTAGIRRRGASGHGYDPIVAAGPHATTLHYGANNGPLTKGSLLLVDVGAEYSNYTADITRTLPIGAKFSSRQAEIFAAVKEIHDFAITQLKPGLLMRDYETLIEEQMGQALRRLKLINRITRRNIRKFYPHAASHSLGLDAHDSADYTKPLLEHMVLTVEPGIYIPKEGIGIRLENDLHLTSKGAVSLSADLPDNLTPATIS